METVSSATDQFVISLSLLANIDHDAVTHPDLRIELVGEPVDLGSKSTARPPYQLLCVEQTGRTANGSVTIV